jgi:hypothetical protein
MNDALKNLQPTTWYKALMVVTAPATLIALVAHRDAPTVIFAGAFLIGLGEWVNHPGKEAEIRPTATGQWAKITSVPRKWNWPGVLQQVAGAILILYGAGRALGFSFGLP